jgi:UDP:flavonoid glycosyltransferase YjiC (YdhE family)
MLALGEALVARGHAVALQTWRRWEQHAVAAGMAFAAAPEYQVFPTRERPLRPYEAAVLAARETVPSVEGFAPDVAVSDVLTPAPALAAELCGVPVATLVPHVFPWSAPGFPPYSFGARLPRTAAGAWLWRRFDPLVARGLEQGRREYNDCRARLGLAPLPEVHTGMSRALTLVGTLPQLEYPRAWPAWTRVVGRCCGSRRASRSRRRRATGRSCSSRRPPRRTPITRCCARRWPGWRTRRCE